MSHVAPFPLYPIVTRPEAVAGALITILPDDEFTVTIVVDAGIPGPVIVCPASKPTKVDTEVMVVEVVVVFPTNVPPPTMTSPGTLM
jgi:hypothetical protein